MHRHAIVTAGFAAVFLLVSACGQREEASPPPSGTVKVSAAASDPAPAPAAEQQASVQVTPPRPAPAPTGISGDPGAKDALVGSWAGQASSCNSGEAIRISADGTYGFEGETGQWALEGDQLRFYDVTVFEIEGGTGTPGDASTVKVLKVDAGAMEWNDPSGSKREFVRCPGVN